MHRIIAIIPIIFSLLSVSRPPEPLSPAPTLIFEQVEHDFGRIGERDGKVTYDYIFTNTGNHPVVITRIITSCKCVDASYPKKPVAPGERGTITITYNPRKQSGIFFKAIQVYSNADEIRSVIFAKGEVIEAE